MANDKLIYASSARKAILKADPKLAYVIDNVPAADAVEVIRCAYCNPRSQDYNPCWLCKKAGTSHDVERCHKTNYGDYEPMQPHCHLCGRKL